MLSVIPSLRTFPICLLVFLVLGSDARAQRLAVFPPANLSGQAEATQVLKKAVESVLLNNGFEIVSEDQVELFLDQERIRETGMLSIEDARRAAEELLVDYVLVGSLISYEKTTPARAAFSLRLIAVPEASIQCAASGGLSALDLRRPFGLEASTDRDRLLDLLTRQVLGKLTSESFSKRVQTGTAFSGRNGNLRNDFNPAELESVAVLPFDNFSGRHDAGRILQELMTEWLAQRTTVRTIEPGEVRSALIEERVLQRGEVDSETLGALRERLSVEAVLIGTVELFREGGVKPSLSPPAIEFYCRLLDTGTGKILWTGSSSVHGRESVKIFDWGEITSVHALAHRAVGDVLGLR